MILSAFCAAKSGGEFHGAGRERWIRHDLVSHVTWPQASAVELLQPRPAEVPAKSGYRPDLLLRSRRFDSWKPKW